MADRRSSHLTQHRSPSFSQQPSPPVPSDAASSRPSTKRSVSGSAQSRPPSSFPAPQATQASPISSTHALSQSSSGISNPVLPAPTKVGFFTPQRSSTAFPAVAGMSSIEQSTWSEASPPINTASPSSVWNGRPPSTMDGDAVTTASASNVSTPGRAPTALDAKDVSVNAPIFTPSPLLPQDGSAWSIGRPVSLTWANDLSARPPPPTELVTDSPASSPSATKRATGKDSSIAQNNASSPSASLNKGGAPAAASKDSASTASPSTKKEPAAPVPKRAPIRSTTLDPRHLAAKRRPSTDIDDDAVPSGQPATGEDEELIDELSSLTIPSADATVSNAIPPQHGYSSPPAFLPAGHHAHRPSGSFPPPPFSPGEAFMHPAPYLPGSGARSPDGYTHGYQGMHPAMAPIDMSGYESYRTTPDPYAPTMPGRAIFASPGSQGSTPQSPSFGPAPLGPHFNPSIRNGEALFYPGVVPGFGPPAMAGGMASPVRPVMPPPGPGQYSFGPGLGVEAHSSQLAQSPMVAPGVPLPVGGIMPSPSSPSVNAPPMSPNGSDSRSSHSISERSLYGPHSRMPSSGAEPFGPGMMSPRPPFAMTNQAGPFVPGQHPMHGMMAAGPMMPWNGRFHDHRRVPTGPGGVMAPVGGYSLAMGMAGGPMDMHYGRNGPGFYGGGPFHPAGPGGNASISGPGSSNGNTTHSRSPILEEFRSRHAKNRKFELADIYGSVVEFSSDQHGSRFIQENLDTATAEEKQTLFDEVLPHTRQLMSDVFGNYVVQKMLEHGDDTQRELLSKEMEGHVLSLSLGTYGCRVIQKAFDHISSSQREKLAQELDGHIMQCVRDQNANHVVQKVIERVDPTKIAFVPTTFVGHVPGLASHCYSCRVLQRTFEYCTEEQSRPLLDELHAEAVSLMQHQYGNYVVQWVLQRGQERDKREVVDKIKGRVLVLSRHKFASNVIEVVVRTATPSVLEELLEEILTPSTDGVTPAGVMTKDQFANYVLQRFFEQSNAKQKARLVEVIRPSLASARRLPGGVGQSKHLVAIERLIEGWTGQEGQ